MPAASTVTNTNTTNPLAQYQAGNTVSDKAKSTSQTASDKLTSDYTTFLKLLTAQLQNQDPTSPMDTNQFTQQLVQYSQVEQQIKTNTKLDSLLTAQNNNGIGSSLGYLGKTVEMDGSAFTASNKGGSFNYNLSNSAKSVSIKIFDESGTLVRTSTLGTTSTGKHTVSWDGTDDNGKQLAAGVYSVAVTASDASGNAVTTNVSTNGTVTGVEKSSGGNILLDVGKLQLSSDKILAIRDASSTGT